MMDPSPSLYTLRQSQRRTLVVERQRVAPAVIVWLGLAATMFSGSGTIGIVYFGVVAVAIVFEVLAGARIDRLVHPLVVFTAWVFVSALLAGTLPSLGNTKAFISTEGRELISMLPLVYFLVVPGSRLVRMNVVRAARATSAVQIVLVLVWSSHHFIRGSEFSGFASSHHIPGYLAGLSLIVLGASFSHRRRPVDLVLCAANVGVVAASGSRTSLLALGIVLCWVVVSARRTTNRVRALTVLLMALLAVPVFVPSVRQTATDFTSPQVFALATQELHGGSPGLTREDAPTANVLKRLGIWHQAIVDWADSPIIGIGSFRINDYNTRLVGIKGVLAVERGGVQVNSDFAAHNIILQMLAENGLIGLVLFGWIMVAMWRRLRRVESVELPFGEQNDRVFSAVLVFCIALNLTSNALISPALTVPLASIIGPYIRGLAHQ